MQVSVSGQHIDIGTSLHQYVEDSLNKGVKKYFENAVNASVVFTKQHHLFSAQIVVNEGTGSGVIIKAAGQSQDVYAAFEEAVGRIEKQLRRYKGRIKDHHKKKLGELENANSLLQGKKYTIANDDTAEEGDGENPLIIAEKPTDIARLTVSEAVMEMNLQNLPALMFINKRTGTPNVVYHRRDGNIAWVDPDIK